MHRLHSESGDERPEPILLVNSTGGIRRRLHPVSRVVALERTLAELKNSRMTITSELVE